MATTTPTTDPAPSTSPTKIHALINYEDPYVQPLLLAALTKHFPPSTLELITTLDALPSRTTPVLQWLQYEALDFPHVVSHSTSSLANAYVIRKALIRKHYLSTTVANWVVKHPESCLGRGWKAGVEFEVDYAEFLDEALVECWELRESWDRGVQGKKEWWILKPGMSERGQGIRLFSSEEELVGIFEGWDPESDDEDEEEGDVRSDAGSAPTHGKEEGEEGEGNGNGIITSQLRHFVAQPYIHPPLLLPPSPSDATATRKFHIRTYVLATSALRVYVYRPMLALFAAKPYTAPSSSLFSNEGPAEDALRAHLTNTCLQETGEREGSVGLFWDLPDQIPAQPSFSDEGDADDNKAEGVKVDDPSGTWKSSVFTQICDLTGEVFEAAARGMGVHFQPLPNAFEIFGLDFMVGIEGDGRLRTYLLEVNAFPDFRQTGDGCRGVVEGLMDEVVETVVVPFFEGKGGQREREAKGKEEGGLVKVLDIDLGRR